MLKWWRELRRSFRGLSDISSLTDEERELVVYSEGDHDWPHLGPMVLRYLEMSDRRVCYVSSSATDPAFRAATERLRVFYIGSGAARTAFFKGLRARVCLMTLPDLEVYELKRSVASSVHYIYAFHAIHSTHTVYRPSAFQHYDTILCVGPHHMRELRREEELKGMKPRRLVPHGSVKLDTLLHDYRDFARPDPRATPFVLLAPSWGPCSFAEDLEVLRPLLRSVLGRAWEVSLRFHPMTLRRLPELVAQISREFGQSPGFQMESNHNNNQSLAKAHVMVSDWSGAATEFAFALEKPVLFVNMPQKINHPGWQDFKLSASEAEIRSSLGAVLEPSDAVRADQSIEQLIATTESYRECIARAREEHVFHLGRSAEAGASELLGRITGGAS